MLLLFSLFYLTILFYYFNYVFNIMFTFTNFTVSKWFQLTVYIVDCNHKNIYYLW